MGNTFQVLRAPWDFLRSAYRTYGPAYRVSILGRKAVVLAGPEVRELYSEAGDNKLDRGFFYGLVQRELEAKELIFKTEGPRHHELRRSAGLAYSRHVAAEHVPEMAAALVGFFEALSPGSAHDALALCGRGLIAAGGPPLAGRDLTPHVSDLQRYAATLMEVAGRTRTPLAAIAPRYRRAKRRSLELTRELLRLWRSGALGDESRSYVVGCFADARDSQGKPLADDDVVAMTALTFVGLGVYINRVVAFMLYEILRDDALRARLTAEVDAAFAHGYTHEGLSEMTLLRAVHTEALRRYPIWFLVPFQAEQDFRFEGKHIAQGEVLLLSSVQEHFLPELYRDPERFDPERCLPPRSEHRHPGAFAPFGHGPRRCVAAGLTEVLSLLFTAVLLHRTRFELVDPGPLRVRLKPLPGPHGLRLRFDGLRDPDAERGAPAHPRSAVERLDEISDRLDWEESDILHSAVDGEMDLCVFPADTEIIRQGDPPDAFYVIEAGEVIVERGDGHGPNETLARLGPGDVFGEIGLLRRQPRNATCTVAPGTDQLLALRCSADAYERLLGSLNITGKELIALVRRRKVATAIASLVPSLGRDAVGSLVGGAWLRIGYAGEAFVREGERAEEFYVVERGVCEVVTGAGTANERLLARLEDGDFFGEVGILRQAPRNATVRVARDCDRADVLVLRKDAFFRLLEAGSPLRQRIFEEASRRSTPGGNGS